MRQEPRFESQDDRKREAETLRILLEGKDLTFEQLDRYAPVDAEIIDNKTMKIVSLCEVKTMSLEMKDIQRVRTSVRKIQHCQKEALQKQLPLCIAWDFFGSHKKQTPLLRGGASKPHDQDLYGIGNFYFI